MREGELTNWGGRSKNQWGRSRKSSRLVGGIRGGFKRFLLKSQRVRVKATEIDGPLTPRASL